MTFEEYVRKKVGEVVPVTADGLPSNSYVFRISREDAIAAEERGDYNGDLVCIPYPSGTTHVQTEQRTGEWGPPQPVLYPEGGGYWLLLSDAAFAQIAADPDSSRFGDSILDPNVKPLFPKGIFLEGKKVGEVVHFGDWFISASGDTCRTFDVPHGTPTEKLPVQHPGVKRERVIGYRVMGQTPKFDTYCDTVVRIAGPFEPDNKVTHVDLGGEN